jgi:hypothetical protein
VDQHLHVSSNQSREGTLNPVQHPGWRHAADTRTHESTTLQIVSKLELRECDIIIITVRRHQGRSQMMMLESKYFGKVATIFWT